MRLIKILITKICRKAAKTTQLRKRKKNNDCRLFRTQEKLQISTGEDSWDPLKRAGKRKKAGGALIPNSFPRYHRHAD